MEGYKPDITKPLSKDEEDMLTRLDGMPVTFDDDSPALSEEQLAEFRRISEVNRANRRKETVTLRLSPRATRKAKSLGKGYTSVLSRILEAALEDNELIERYL